MSYRKARKTLILILSLNLAVALAKGIFGTLSGSLSMVSDALHSFLDSFSNILGILAMTISMRDSDRNHHYGHGKFETLGTLLVGTIISLTALWILREAYLRFKSGAVPVISHVTVIVMLLTIAVNIFVYRYEMNKGSQLGSSFLIADSMHTKSDIYVSLSVLCSFLFVKLDIYFVDPLLSILIAGMIIRMGTKIIRESVTILTDGVLIECEDDVGEILRKIEGVRGYHKFRCRGKPGEMYAEIHLLLDSSLTVGEAHEISDEVERRIKEKLPIIKEITVHIEPEK
ncbi:MAG: cation transporter [Archaeoglobi archaeon]|nr:cation transporter [Candidatus Mnemosynella sp.]